MKSSRNKPQTRSGTLHRDGSFPLTPALSPRERENRSSVLRQSPAPLCPSLSPRERAGVRGKGLVEGQVISHFKKSLARLHRRTGIQGRSSPTIVRNFFG